MPLPIRPLPTIQNWDCHGCTDCCRTYSVSVSEDERARIDAQNWDQEPALRGVLPVVYDASVRGYRMNHTADGACVMLGPDNRCRIHAKFGSAAKPMACRVYPFVFVPAKDHWRVGIRFSCPSAAKNLGRPMSQQGSELIDLATLVEADLGATVAEQPVPPLQKGQIVPWADLLRFTNAVLQLLRADEHPLERRLRMVAGLIDFCKPASFEKVLGERLGEFLAVAVAVTESEVPADPYSVRPPGWVGRMLFRQMLAVYVRKDNGPDKGIASRGKWTRLRAAWRFGRGRGGVPKLHGRIPDGVRFADTEKPFGELSEAAQGMLARFYQVKVESLQFVGPSNHRRPFWVGLESLLLTYPAILWLTRVFAFAGRDREDALIEALRLVDDSFGMNRLLGSGRQTWAVQTLGNRGEVARLIAWYSR